MTSLQVASGAAKDVRTTWFIGGTLLLGSLVLRPYLPPGDLAISLGNVTSVMFAAALVLFAFGLRGGGSITARRPIGTAALTALAAWSLLFTPLTGAIPIPDEVFQQSGPSPLLVIGYIEVLVWFILALISVVEIARAGVIPRPWRWAPAWVLTAVAVAWLLLEAVGLSSSWDMGMLVVAFNDVARTSGTVFLGVVAVVLADRSGRRAAMTDQQGAPPPASDARRPWIVGGSLLIASILFGAFVPLGGNLGYIVPALFAVALVVFALGVRTVESVTGRRPLGTIAVILLAAWSLAAPLLTDHLADGILQGPVQNAFPGLGYLEASGWFVLALIAVVQIARARVLPEPWHRAPAWVLAAVTATWSLMQLVWVSSMSNDLLVGISITTLDILVRVGGAVFLGVLAIVLGDRAGSPYREASSRAGDTAASRS